MTVPRHIHVFEERSALQVRDQNIFRPISSTAKKYFQSMVETTPMTKPTPKPIVSPWRPPLYRNTTLLSSPSTTGRSGAGTWSDSSNSYSDENSERGRFTLPADFIPPRHNFTGQSRDEGNHLTCNNNNNKTRISASSSSTSSSTSSSSFCDDGLRLRDTDIVCGRGAPTLVHPGNKAYRDLIRQYEASYLCAKRSDKPVIAMQVLDVLKERGIRFVRRHRNSGNELGWEQVEENKAYDKVCQSLREGAPELRRKMLASDAKKSIEAQTHTSSYGQHPQYQTRRDLYNCSPLPCF